MSNKTVILQYMPIKTINLCVRESQTNPEGSWGFVRHYTCGNQSLLMIYPRTFAPPTPLKQAVIGLLKCQSHRKNPASYGFKRFPTCIPNYSTCSWEKDRTSLALERLHHFDYRHHLAWVLPGTMKMNTYLHM